MRWYPWLRPAFEQLIGQYQAGRAHHALLMHALPGMGDDALIYAICRWLMCEQPDGHKSCGHCRGCQLMQAGTHPDYHQVVVEKGKSSLGVDPIRHVTEKLYSRSGRGGARIVWIPDAECLTESAANALLKTLEEPPENCWFFLGCREPARLLITLRSRCLYWYLSPPDEHYAQAWLARENPQDPLQLQTALRLSMGAPGAALTLLQPENWKRRAGLWVKVQDALQQQDLLLLAGQLNDDHVVESLHWISTLLLDALKMQRGAVSWLTNADARDLIQQLCSMMPESVIQAVLHHLFQCREQLRDVPGLNRELMLTELLLRWEQWMRPGATLPAAYF
ncbi:DNA polymerase III subunit delta' [Shimwellia pseudoproteus]|uniref:DNA polymerase III subunit delta' n=1 Tax=Shimwellia pseudoproteus TaxID=570012 RepID=UPI0018EAEB9A|nr:DNA polymerase III subunit delta' [Shimwellia pseudoproteus]MBJ3815482.1 DNA polymerase III subunit delta' [Shimwellia pseudoproteus]